ncbi:hypothetical protein RRF57_005484 [Xylaria bambusicola]|uniref:Uncharacterized protein n=1 Tax=Xylaria bambusicola TaxID=326684 RepID=A0AAN7UMC2_9PEZI
MPTWDFAYQNRQPIRRSEIRRAPPAQTQMNSSVNWDIMIGCFHEDMSYFVHRYLFVEYVRYCSACINGYRFKPPAPPGLASLNPNNTIMPGIIYDITPAMPERGFSNLITLLLLLAP